MWGRCSAEARAACPLVQGCVGSDTHHFAFPANQYRTSVEKRWRELPINKEQLPRCVHNAIHSAGYVPEKPPRTEMLQEVWSQEIPYRAQDERLTQLALGQAMLKHIPEDAA